MEESLVDDNTANSMILGVDSRQLSGHRIISDSNYRYLPHGLYDIIPLHARGKCLLQSVLASLPTVTSCDFIVLGSFSLESPKIFHVPD